MYKVFYTAEVEFKHVLIFSYSKKYMTGIMIMPQSLHPQKHAKRISLHHIHEGVACHKTDAHSFRMSELPFSSWLFVYFLPRAWVSSFVIMIFQRSYLFDRRPLAFYKPTFDRFLKLYKQLFTSKLLSHVIGYVKPRLDDFICASSWRHHKVYKYLD